jgi:hypothetical protein
MVLERQNEQRLRKRRGKSGNTWATRLAALRVEMLALVSAAGLVPFAGVFS